MVTVLHTLPLVSICVCLFLSLDFLFQIALVPHWYELLSNTYLNNLVLWVNMSVHGADLLILFVQLTQEDRHVFRKRVGKPFERQLFWGIKFILQSNIKVCFKEVGLQDLDWMDISGSRPVDRIRIKCFIIKFSFRLRFLTTVPFILFSLNLICHSVF